MMTLRELNQKNQIFSNLFCLRLSMRKPTSVTICAILFLLNVMAQTSHAQVTTEDGVLELEGLFGIGSNTSYFVVDFGGSPVSATGPRDTYAFGYQWDAPDTSAADGLLEIVSQSTLELDTTDFGGDLGLAINTFSYEGDTDTPDFNEDNRFWTTFVGALTNGEVAWQVSDFGISSITLTDEAFLGFRAQTFGAAERPVVPVAAIPEPAAVFLLSVAACGASTIRRRRG